MYQEVIARTFYKSSGVYTGDNYVDGMATKHGERRMSTILRCKPRGLMRMTASKCMEEGGELRQPIRTLCFNEIIMYVVI